MGTCGYLLPERAVFFLTAALTIPALAALRPLARIASPVQPPRERGPTESKASLRRVLANRRLIVFAAAAALFTFANNPILPLAASALTNSAQFS